ncbi:MAG: pyruvate kinase [Myxococcales bacterium]|nr:pyruvate kinase [Myxococcales bacterium]
MVRCAREHGLVRGEGAWARGPPRASRTHDASRSIRSNRRLKSEAALGPLCHAAAVGIRRVKIVCTIGPASDAPEALDALIDAGMNVARLNFSHGSHDEHSARFARVRAAAAKRGREVAILQDLCGPKIRCARFVGGTLDVPLNAEFALAESLDANVVAPANTVLIQYRGLGDDLRAGDVLLLDDGRVGLEVIEAGGGRVRARCTQAGVLRDKVGVHIPADRVRIESLTDKDKHDLSFGLSIGVDYVALSFVRSAAEVRLVRDICEAWGRPTPIVAKIETPQAIEHLESIILASDAVMVARGDLGVEFSPERVPVIQRKILGLARFHQRPAIVATEMMQSMMTAKRPTRAEASDVATAVFDGADAVMLSGETATGEHPALVVRTMHKIIVEAEQSAFYRVNSGKSASERARVSEAIARGACDIAASVGSKVLVAFTEGGQTARFASGARPPVPIIGLSPNIKTLRQLCLLWGIVPYYVEPLRASDEMVDRAHALLLANGIVTPGDSFVVIFGAPVGVSGTTNAIQVKVVE